VLSKHWPDGVKKKQRRPGNLNMKLTSAFLFTVLLVIACDAALARTIRADIAPNGSAGWFSQPSFPYTPSFSLLSGIDPGVGGAPTLYIDEHPISDEIGLSIYELPIPQQVAFSMPQALSYDWPNADSPISQPAQVQVYRLDQAGAFAAQQLSTPSGALVSVGGDTEVEFNYSSSSHPGIASFSYDGIKYQSSDTGSALANGDTNDFMFNSAGAFVGWVNGSGQLATNLTGSGWMSAPEMDPASGLTALTLLAGSLAVVRGRRHRPVRTATA
jgi:hypothetical protein